jgi:vacuolar-type H+-ATPase subunit I/STV1
MMTANEAQQVLQQVSKRQEDGGVWALFKSKSDVEQLTHSLERVRQATIRCLPWMVVQTAEKVANLQYDVKQLQQDSDEISNDVKALTLRVDQLEVEIQRLDKQHKELENQVTTKHNALDEQQQVLDKQHKALEQEVAIKHKTLEEKVESISQVQQQEGLEQMLENRVPRIDFDHDMYKLEKRYLAGTRRKYAQVFQAWLKLKTAKDESADSRLLWIRGGPGVGKSVIAAMLMREFKRNIVGIHFCHHDIQDCRSPFALIKSLASQLADRHDEYKSKLVKAVSSYSKEKINDMDVKKLFETPTEWIVSTIRACISR